MRWPIFKPLKVVGKKYNFHFATQSMPTRFLEKNIQFVFLTNLFCEYIIEFNYIQFYLFRVITSVDDSYFLIQNSVKIITTIDMNSWMYEVTTIMRHYFLQVIFLMGVMHWFQFMVGVKGHKKQSPLSANQ